MTPTSEPPTPADDGPSRSVPERPALAPGVVLAGEMEAPGFRESQWLIERNGTYLQVPELLYRVAESIDGRRKVEEIAEAVTGTTEWALEPEHVRFLLANRLIPRGLVVAADGAVSEPSRFASPLRLGLRRKVVGPRVIDPATRVLQELYALPILIPVVLWIVVGHVWVYVQHGLSDALLAIIYQPALFAIVIVVALVGTVFHELGHAAAARYGGGHVRGIGVGFYAIFPAVFTDTSDTYRLSRWARVRIDLGGIYFHLIFNLGVMAITIVSGWEFLLVTVLLINLELVRQLLFPFVRFDGYWLLADLTGIPDPFSAMGPFLRRVSRARRAMLPKLKRWVSIVFGTYVVVTIPLLAGLLYLFVTRAPRFVAAIVDSFSIQTHAFADAARDGAYLAAYAAATQMLILALMLVGIVYFVYSLARFSWKVSGRVWRRRLAPRPA
jgi:putative peptide zinc metalloprotease protein